MKPARFSLFLLLSIPFSGFTAVVFEDKQSSAEVYGRVEFNVQNDDNKVHGIGSARLGFKGRSYITDALQAIVRGEWDMVAENSGHNLRLNLQEGKNVNCGEPEEIGNCQVTGFIAADTSGSLQARHVYAGFEIGNYGQLIFGQTETAFYDALASTDIFNNFGFEGSDFIYVGRQEGQVIYTANLAEVHFSASYQFHNEDATLQLGGSGGSDVISGGDPVVLDNAFASTLGYSFDFGLSLYGAYAQENYDVGTKKNWAGSINYIQDEIYMAVVASGSNINDTNLRGYEAVLGYDFSPVLVYGGYNKQERRDIDNSLSQAASLADGDYAENWLMAAQVDFNSYFKSWIEYKLDQAEVLELGAKRKNRWSVGLQYNF